MLLKRYTIPIVLGACLGMIMTGVQISATSLNAALGSDRAAAVMVLDKVDEGGVSGQLLGKSFTAQIPRAGELSSRAGAVAGEVREISDQAFKSGSYCLEKLYTFTGDVYQSVADLFRAVGSPP
ncbi:MAG: hypothetical protein JL50_00595 [Peptococcaceae bacterium BICA1-7]|nr:MAG: hypothetical protein JL50_00595 [Peptococcaceae bacterium BICA1-7]HBV98114.1 hypothetical protein [Desulfotomaculum sp.]